MKLIVLRTNLLEGLGYLERAVGGNVNLPILKSFLLKADEGKIVLSATNLELAVRSIVPGKLMEKGELAIPFAIFNNIVKNLTSERITLEKKDKQLILSTDNYEALIQGQDPKEFPIIPSVHNLNKSLKIKSDTLSDVFASVIVATQYSDIRPEISGVFFDLSNDELVLAATDGFRLAERKVEANQIQSSLDNISLVIPLATAEELLRVFSGKESEVEIFIDPNQILFKNADKEITSRLVDGQFPDYKTIIPKQVQNEVVVSRQELISAAKLISSFSGRGNDVTLKIGENKKFLELYSATSAVGENRYRVPIKMKGEKFSIIFNWRYLLDGLKVYKNDEIVLGVNTADKPTTIKSLSETNQLYILMPIKA